MYITGHNFDKMPEGYVAYSRVGWYLLKWKSSKISILDRIYPRLNSFSLFYPSRMWIWIRKGQVDPSTGWDWPLYIRSLGQKWSSYIEFEQFQESVLPNRMNWTPFYKFLIRLKVFEDAFVKIFKKTKNIRF